MKVIQFILVVFSLNSCFIIRSVRDEQYCNKYDATKITVKIDTNAIYEYIPKLTSDNQKHSFFRFDNNGKVWSYTFDRNREPDRDEIFDSLLPKYCYVHVKNTLKWEVYPNSMDGWIQCRVKIIGNGDSLEYYSNGYYYGFNYLVKR